MNALTDPAAQRKAALDVANRNRLARAKIKREIRDGKKSIEEVISDPPFGLDTCSLMELLQAIKRVGKYRSLSMLKLAGLSPAMQLGELTENQKAMLVGAVMHVLGRGK